MAITWIKKLIPYGLNVTKGVVSTGLTLNVLASFFKIKIRKKNL